MYKSLSIPYLGWASIESRYPTDEPESRWGHTRGRLTEHVWWMPLGPLTLTVYGRGKSYRKLTGLPKMSIDWILDEFDSSFNDLAVASLRYHLDYSVCDREDRRPVYEDLITRLSERDPLYTAEEMAVLNPPGRDFEDDWEQLPGGGYLMRPSTPEERVVYATAQARTDAYHERIRQARHDFVDIMRELWS